MLYVLCTMSLGRLSTDRPTNSIAGWYKGVVPSPKCDGTIDGGRGGRGRRDPKVRWILRYGGTVQSPAATVSVCGPTGRVRTARGSAYTWRTRIHTHSDASPACAFVYSYRVYNGTCSVWRSTRDGGIFNPRTVVEIAAAAATAARAWESGSRFVSLFMQMRRDHEWTTTPPPVRVPRDPPTECRRSSLWIAFVYADRNNSLGCFICATVLLYARAHMLYVYVFFIYHLFLVSFFSPCFFILFINFFLFGLPYA